MKDLTECLYCKKKLELVGGEALYPRRKDLASKKFWRCPDTEHCDSYVGCHPGTDIPLGTVADRETRLWRGRAHKAFDKLWLPKKNKGEARKEAYAWLQAQMGSEIHIGGQDVAGCIEVIRLTTDRLTELNNISLPGLPAESV